MHIFFVRNYLSIVTAESIIIKYKITDAIAYLLNYGGDAYYSKMHNNMNSALWAKIFRFPIPELGLYGDSLTFKKNGGFDKVLQKTKEILYEDKASQIYLLNISTSVLERLLYKAARDLNITVNYYEEGANNYIDLFGEWKKGRRMVKQAVDLTFLRKYDFLFSKGFEKIFADNLYCCFPDAYTIPNVNKKHKIELSFKMSEEQTKLLEKLEIDTLFLSRPLSEDHLVSVKDEIKVLSSVIENFSKEKDFYVKFHPRESLVKINKLRRIVSFKELPAQYAALPAEKLTLCGKINNLVGYETGAIMYSSELSKLNVFSMLECVKDKSIYLRLYYDFYKSYFPKIKFLNMNH